MYVVVKLAGKKIVRHYIGRISSVDGYGEYTVKFMKKIRAKTFAFPERDDLSVIDEPDVQMILKCPKYNENNKEFIFSDNLNFPNLF